MAPASTSRYSASATRAPGEICLAAEAYLAGRPTLNRVFFNWATEAGGRDEPDHALSLWQACLECGDLMAHYGLAYTLYELGCNREAYRHARAYTEITPYNSWAWCWLGHICVALGERDEGRQAYEQALELEDEGAEETNASEGLAELK